MLGKAFESRMVTQERKPSGSNYTPQALVERITTASLAEALQTDSVDKDVVEQALAGTVPDSATRGILLDRTASLRVLDPACGSGAFLVHTLEQITTLRALLGDLRPISAIRRSVLTTSIYGVDINPMAVWLCELRLWLSTVIDSEERDPMRVLPLPNLDHQIHVGDTLTGGSFDDATHPPSARSVAALRQRYARSHGPRKRILAGLLGRMERHQAVAQIDRSIIRHTAERRELVCAARAQTLFAERATPNNLERGKLLTLRETVRRLRTQRRRLLDGGALPFTFAAHCADVAEAGGFDVILGNPPWVRLQHIAPADRTTLRAAFTTFRNAAWETGATHANAGPGFSSQIDLAALFLERSVDLLAPHGTLGLLLPAKLWRSLAGGGTRRLLQAQTQLVALEDLSDSPTTFNAAVYPSILIARRTMTRSSLLSPSPTSVTATNPLPMVTAAVHRADTSVKWHASTSTLALDSSPGSPWLLIPPAVRAAFDCMARAGVFLAESDMGRPYLGVKSGYNDARFSYTRLVETTSWST